MHNENKGKVWEHFCVFVIDTYENNKVCGKNVKRSVHGYLKLYIARFPNMDRPSASQVYNWIHDHKYGLMRNLFKRMLKQIKPDKPKTQVQPMKYESIEERSSKDFLQANPGNRLADTVEGKKSDFQVIATMLDQKTGKFTDIYTTGAPQTSLGQQS